MASQQPLLQEVQKQQTAKKMSALIKRQFKSLRDDSGTTLRVMSWNTLAQALSQGDDNFILCPSEALDWSNRHLHLLEEMLTYNASILCLQEVDRFSFFEEKLKSVGYTGVFFPKPDSPCLYCENNSGSDGCAMFWKSDDLDLLEHKNVVLQDSCGDTNQVSIINKFQMKETKKEFYIAVTHLKAKNGYATVRQEQGQYLISLLEKMTKEKPLIVCGDFNAEHTEEVYEVFKSSKLDLASSYAQLTEDGSEIPYTTWKVRGSPTGLTEHSRTIDYMWYTPSRLRVQSLLMMPSVEEIGKDRLPSHSYPSDHLSLVCDFIFT